MLVELVDVLVVPVVVPTVAGVDEEVVSVPVGAEEAVVVVVVPVEEFAAGVAGAGVTGTAGIVTTVTGEGATTFGILSPGPKM